MVTDIWEVVIPFLIALLFSKPILFHSFSFTAHLICGNPNQAMNADQLVCPIKKMAGIF